MARTIAINLLGYDNLSRSFNAAERSARQLQTQIEKLDKASNTVGLLTLAGGLTAVTQAAAPALAAIVALPAAMAAVKIVSATVKVGLTGVGEAMSAVAEGDAKKMDAALKKLAPSARTFVKEMGQVQKSFVSVQKSVQQNMFAGLDKELEATAKVTLPTLKTGMNAVSVSVNGMIKEVLQTARVGSNQRMLNSLFMDTAKIMDTLRGVVRPLVDIVLKLATAGMSLVKRMAEWGVAGAKSASAFLNSEKGARALAQTVQKGGDVLAQFGRIIRNVAIGFISIIGQAKSFKSQGDGIITTIEKGTLAFAGWAKSMQGQQASSDVFKMLGETAKAMLQVLPLLLGPLGAIAQVLLSLPDPVRGIVVQMIAWGVVINLVIGRLKLLAVTAALFSGGAAVVGFVGGMMQVSRGAAAGASAATRYGAALRLNAAAALMIVKAQIKAAAATAMTTIRMVASTVAAKAAATASKIWAAGIWLVNGAMAGNPIALVIIAVVALVAAIVIAYKKSETFRNIVQGAWNGIKAAAAVAWAFLKGVFAGLISAISNNIVPAFKTLGGWAQTVWTGIQTSVRVTWGIVKPIFNTITNVVKTVMSAAFTVLGNVVKAVWIIIQVAIKVAWMAIRGYFNAMKAFVQNVLAPLFKWFYNSIIKPVWTWIRDLIKKHWFEIKVVFNAIKLFLQNTLAPAFRAFRTAVSTVWAGVRSSINTAWNSGIKPVFNAVKSALGTVKDAFVSAVNSIKKTWDRIKDIAKVPVNFVIGVYNTGIVGLVNKIADFAGVKTRLSPINKLANGGVLPGYAPGKDKLLAAVSPGESVFRPEFTRAVGSGWVTRANAVARRQGVAGVQRWMTGADRLGGEGLHFANGGVVPGFAGNFDIGGVVGGLVKGIKDFTIGNVAKASRAAMEKIVGVVPGSGVFRDVLAGIPKWMIDKLSGWIKAKIGMGGMGGPGVARALSFAKAQAGKPYLWGGVGPGGYDCSGFMSAIHNVIRGKNPYSRLYSTHAFSPSGGPLGFAPNVRSGFMVGVTHAGVGHMGGTLGGVNVESSGSAGVRVGGAARGVSNGLFPYKYGLKADTGALMLRPGWNPPTFNGTGKPELLTTPGQAGAGSVYNVNISASAGTNPAEIGRQIVAVIQAYERRSGKSWRS